MASTTSLLGIIAVAVGALVFTTGPLYRVRTWWSYDDPLSTDVIVVAVQLFVLVAAIASLATGNRWRRLDPMLAVVGFGLIAWMLLGALWSADATTTLREAGLVGVGVVIGAAAVTSVPERDVIVGSWIGVHLGLAWSAVAIVTVAAGTQDGNGDWTGVYFNPNSLALVASLGLLVSLATFAAPDLGSFRPWCKASAGLAVVADLWLIWGTSAVTPLVALMAALGVAGVAFIGRGAVRAPGEGKPNARQLAGGSAAVFVGAGAIAWFTRSAWLGAVGQTSDLTGRTDLWEVSLDWFGRRPLVGHGYMSLWTDDEFLADILAARGELLGSAHSSFIEVLLGTGLVGFVGLLTVLWLGWMGAGTRVLTTRSWFDVWPLAALVFWIVENLTESLLVSGQIAPVLLGAALFAGTSAQKPAAHMADGRDVVVV
jgi:exopolysaccharide production protein ExoQ